MAITDVTDIDSAHVLMSTMGGFVCVDGKADEIIVSAIAGGVSLAGWAVTITNATGVEIAVDINGSTDRFVGILLPHYKTDVDTAITGGELIEIVIPQKGHRYIVWISDPTGTIDVGASVCFHATIDGQFDANDEATIEVQSYCASLSKYIISTDKFAEIIWRA